MWDSNDKGLLLAFSAAWEQTTGYVVDPHFAESRFAESHLTEYFW